MKNFRLTEAKCCGTCHALKQDGISGHYYCGQEEGAKYPTVDFDPQEGEQWRYVCDGWNNGKKVDEKLRVWHVKNPPRNPDYYPVDSVEQAIAKIEELAEKELKDSSIVINAFGLEICEDGEWTEYYDEKGKDIFVIIEGSKKKK